MNKTPRGGPVSQKFSSSSFGSDNVPGRTILLPLAVHLIFTGPPPSTDSLDSDDGPLDLCVCVSRGARCKLCQSNSSRNIFMSLVARVCTSPPHTHTCAPPPSSPLNVNLQRNRWQQIGEKVERARNYCRAVSHMKTDRNMGRLFLHPQPVESEPGHETHSFIFI